MLSKRLKKYDRATAIVAIHATHEAKNTPTVATVATMQVATPTKTESIDTVSNWWLLHFADLDPVQVAIWPPCNHADVLALNPQAIAAEPLLLQVLDVANDCPIDQCEVSNQTLNNFNES
jgi:cell envelope opacity-associated protein A